MPMYNFSTFWCITVVTSCGRIKSHLAKPIVVNGKGFKEWWQLVKLYLMANNKDFPTNKSMILFMLSFIMEGLTTQWAQNFSDWAIDENNSNFGSWANFEVKIKNSLGNKNVCAETQNKLEALSKAHKPLRNTSSSLSFYTERLNSLITSISIICRDFLRDRLMMASLSSSTKQRSYPKTLMIGRPESPTLTTCVIAKKQINWQTIDLSSQHQIIPTQWYRSRIRQGLRRTQYHGCHQAKHLKISGNQWISTKQSRKGSTTNVAS